MHDVRKQLFFEIETPSNAELAKRFASDFAKRQAMLSDEQSVTTPGYKHKKRVSKSAKKLHKRNGRKYRKATSV